MMEAFHQTAAGITNPALQDWAQKGRPVVGYTCSFLPPEIFHAAGILPYRIRGIETQSMEIGDAYYGPFVCTFPKCLLQLAGEGKYRFLNGAVISTGCDAMRRLDECWRKTGEDFPGTLPDFFQYFDVPHKTDPHAMAWFENQIRSIIKATENHFQLTITEEKLKDAIAVYNRGRSLLWEVETLRAGENPSLSGVDAFSIAVAATVMPRKIFNQNLEEVLKQTAKADPSTSGNRKRILLAGSINDDIDLVRIVEESGSCVVAENICFGVRGREHQVSWEGDPITALARFYLSNSVCPRMFGAYDQRFAHLKEKALRSKAQGVVLQNIRFCDLHGSENGLLEKDFQSIGIPCLRLEREYGPLTETGRMKMRIQAFLEQLPESAGGKYETGN